MAGYVFKGFLTSFEIGNLLSVGHCFIDSLRVHMTEQICCTSLSATIAIEMRATMFLGETSPATDTVCGVVGSKVVWNTSFTPNEAWWFATGTLIESVSFKICSVLHHAG